MLTETLLRYAGQAMLFVAALITPAMATDQPQEQAKTSPPSLSVPGMPMQGYMMGPGMMGPGMMGPGMMGPGMMGPGMMGPWQALDLNDKQREQVTQIQKDYAKTYFELQSKMAEESAKLAELYAAEKPDSAAIGKVYSALSELRRQLVEANLDASNRMVAVLTKEQRSQLQRWQRGMMMGPGY